MIGCRLDGVDTFRRPSGAERSTVERSIPEPAIAAEVETLATLGNDTRYETLRMVTSAADGVCDCELAPPLGVSQDAVRQALSRLFDAGLVERRKGGRWRYYTPTPRAERLLEVLDATRSLAEELSTTPTTADATSRR